MQFCNRVLVGYAVVGVFLITGYREKENFEFPFKLSDFILFSYANKYLYVVANI